MNTSRNISCKTAIESSSSSNLVVNMIRFESDPKWKFAIDEKSNLIEVDSSSKQFKTSGSRLTLATFTAPTDLNFCLHPCEKIHSFKV